MLEIGDKLHIIVGVWRVTFHVLVEMPHCISCLAGEVDNVASHTVICRTWHPTVFMLMH